MNKGDLAMGKKTPLYECHEKLNGKIIEFAGYLLPVQYSGIIAEHMAVRTNAGLFDVSHMGEFMLTGSDCVHNLNRLLTNDFGNMSIGQARYSPMCNENGGTVDDVIVYRCGEHSYLIVVNAANREKDFKWISQHIAGDVKISDNSNDYAQIALQGPLARQILQNVTEDIPQKKYHAVLDGQIKGTPCIVSGTGYTGEDGFELYCRPDDAVFLWNTLLDAGKDFGLVPCGLGARDTLRLEAAMPLYGHELDEDISPLEAGLSFFVKTEKEDFIGKKAMLEKNSGLKRAGLRILDKGIARENCSVYVNNEKVGKTTSGTYCPYLDGAYAMALISGEANGEAQVEVRGRRLRAEFTALPFYKEIYKKRR
jgi:aminomethyltransferase